MLLTRRQRNSVFYVVSDREPKGLTPLGEGIVTCSPCLPGPGPGRGRGQHGAERRVSGALAAVRVFCYAGRSADGGGFEWYPGLDPFSGLCGDQEKDGWLYVHARGLPSICSGRMMLGDEVGSLLLLFAPDSLPEESFHPLPC